MFLPLLLLFPLLFLFFPSLATSFRPVQSDLDGLTQRGKVTLDPANLDLFFFRSAVSALFKAKANAILAALPATERIVFRQCEADSEGRLNLLAKCFVSLFNIRDFEAGKKRKENMQNVMAAQEEKRHSEMPSWEWILTGQFLKPSKDGKKGTRRGEDGEDEASRGNGTIEAEELAQKKGGLADGNGLMSAEKTLPLEKSGSNLARNFATFKKLTEEKKAKKRRRKWKEQGREVRRKRNIEEDGPERWKAFRHFPNVQKLLKVERFYRLVEKCNEFIQRKDEEHSRFIQNGNFPVRLATGPIQRSPLLAQAETQLRGTLHFDKLSILSPKLLSILPENAENGTGTAREDLLSPTFLSFHEQGDFSLPSLLKLVFTNDGRETLPWLDLLLQISGAGSTLDELLKALEPNIREVEQKIHPAILKLQAMEERFKELGRMMRGRRGQRERMESRGYAFLDPEQSRMLGTDGGEWEGEGGGLAEEELEQVLEEDIRAIARMAEERQLGRGRRAKRFLSTQPYGQVRMLNPYFFANQINDSAILRRVVVSPKAFSAEILTADFFRFDVLSPEAFITPILSPRAAMAYILSPTAFTARVLSPQAIIAEVLNPKALAARVLSPRAFSALVLSPRLLLIDVLSPKAFEIKILNPTTLGFVVLSPTIIGTSVMSPANHVMVVLSPSILMPGFLNQGSNNVNILSPQILSNG